MISERVQSTQSPPLVKLGKLAASLDHCISLGQGAPYYSPPQNILEKLSNLLQSSTTHRYSPDPGLLKVRTSVVNKLREDQRITVDPEQVVLTPGANQAFYNILVSIADPGDEIILLTPYYFNHYMACSILNVHAHLIPLTDDFHIDHSLLEQAITDRTRAVVIVNPGNPTGMIYSREDLMGVVEIADKHNILVLADETYEYFTYSKDHVPLATLAPNQVISIGSFSKTFGIPGWRLGYYAGPKELIEQSIKVQDTIGICAPRPSQLLGKLLIDHRQQLIPEFVSLMKRNHDLSRDLLEEVDWLDPTPSGGAYYLFPRQMTDKPTLSLVKELITEYGVYIVPGGGFGSDWQQYCRISFANVDEEELKEAFSRLRSYT